jgi:hypothetical protein
MSRRNEGKLGEAEDDSVPILVEPFHRSSRYQDQHAVLIRMLRSRGQLKFLRKSVRRSEGSLPPHRRVRRCLTFQGPPIRTRTRPRPRPWARAATIPGLAGLVFAARPRKLPRTVRSI